jgi:hypothetical protein
VLWSDRRRGGLWWRLPVVLAGVAMPVVGFGSLNPFPDDPDGVGFYSRAAGAGARHVGVNPQSPRHLEGGAGAWAGDQPHWKLLVGGPLYRDQRKSGRWTP